MDTERPLLFRGQALNLSMFTAQEIREESILKIVDPTIFNELGHPVRNGLYDPRLGAVGDSSCEHCHLRHNNCPGHFGHIDLPLPVYNPMTHPLLSKLLKQACLVCHRFRAGKDYVQALTRQLQLARKGYPTESNEVEQLIKEGNFEKIEEIAQETEKKSRAPKVHSNTVHRVLNSFLAQAPRPCMWCGSSPHKISTKNNCIVVERTKRTKEGADELREELLLPVEAVEMIQQITKKEETFLSELFYRMHSKQTGYNFLLPMFFIEVVLVVPPGCRPMNKLSRGNMLTHHQKSIVYQEIIKISMEIFNIEDKSAKSVTSAYIRLQEAVSSLYSVTNQNTKGVTQGVKQILEKKEGIFRNNIMGKRVNYTARSVISPDPAIAVDEVGIPQEFACKLTIPVGISPVNIESLREAVINGPVYPGAEYIEDATGGLISLRHITQEKRMHLANQLLTRASCNAHSITDKDSLTGYTGELPNKNMSFGVRKVWRHMRTGDNVLVNRQPSLHKVSMMGHKVKILPNERTIRLHYVNCNSYNADFDGDEMNVHFPQDIVSQVEVSEICSTNQCFISATSGDPVRGHVQDHVVMGALLSQKNVFIQFGEYSQMIVSALWGSAGGKRFLLEEPAILRPKRLYTGQQAITAVIRNLGIEINVTCKSKLGDTLIIRQSVVIAGSFDKSQIGAAPYGLAHAVNEKYGGTASNALLTAIGRLFNRALIVFGHSCTMDDLMIESAAETGRHTAIEEGLLAGSIASREFLQNKPDFLLKTSKSAAEGEVPEDKRELDAEMRKPTGECSSRVLEIASAGLCLQKRRNRMYMMVASGAKGSLVNLGQIISMLGQQELEGMRVPIMPTGRTLPTFLPLEDTPRAHGFISQRFLTGVHQEEFFFHCMAGREGLIDTAVKTSRSGYLQRCLIKHLEGIKIEADGSVRDSDGSVIQMVYGEDGIHPEKAAYLHNHQFFNENPVEPKILSSVGLQVGDLYNLRAQQGKVSRAFHESSSASEHKESLWWRYLKAAAEPGEAVGILAAQGIGEPSTQMTLNTFHLAGVGGKNVTLGMPRLKELVMFASRNIKTPIISVPATREPSAREMEMLRVSGRRSVMSVITSIKMDEQVLVDHSTGLPVRQLKISLLPLPGIIGLVESTLQSEFFVMFSRNMKAFIKSLSDQQITESVKDVRAADAQDKEARDDKESSEEEESSETEEEQSENTENNENNEHLEEEQEKDLPECDAMDKVSDPSCTNDGTWVHITLHAPISYKTLYLPRVENILKKILLKTDAEFESCTYANGQYLIQKGTMYGLHNAVGDLLLGDLMDLSECRSNSIWETASTLGIEAARIAIIREIAAVFEVYGIKIDYRHLSLIADYMTHTGTIIAFNRGAFSVMGSPIQRITFETAYSFIKDAVVDGAVDGLTNPSSCIAIGKPVSIGTNTSEIGYALDAQ
ncbi:DNA-directed RNA polymerase I subunit RPA1 [Nematocida minor]|uniref:DNA-directed RNA polymerase I subunit RPA1 n=1 Tax=Nematocida minor TaxID=1912983 RepID=UPI00221EC739|nr:DNA-directed RNA polymerase I subunit RPA1 [Nematocida minor]KAI5192644.1 DNA-directed RNA polymerase I subunit RPA1 [Nematocida minor]